MNWEDEGYLLAKKKFRENANIIDVFTKNYGRVSGIVYGGNSRKIRNFLQISNKISIFFNSKNENKIGYFKTELIEPISPRYFNDKKRTSALLSLTSILNLLLPISQPYKSIYNSVSELFTNMNEEKWFYLYIFWELNLIKELGFDPNLNSSSVTSSNNDSNINVNIDNINYSIPSFMISRKIPILLNNSLIKKALVFNRNIMVNKFFAPNNLNFPKTRIILENYFI